jgi:hypothetical protein
MAQPYATAEEWLASCPELAGVVLPNGDSLSGDRHFKHGDNGRVVDPNLAPLDLMDAPVELVDVEDEKPDVIELPPVGHWRNWRRPSDKPDITLVLGVALIGWCPAVEAAPPGPDCPACHGVHLGPRDFCLACRRSGLDDVLPKILPREQPARKSYFPDPVLKGGCGC